MVYGSTYYIKHGHILMIEFDYNLDYKNLLFNDEIDSNTYYQPNRDVFK